VQPWLDVLFQELAVPPISIHERHADPVTIQAHLTSGLRFDDPFSKIIEAHGPLSARTQILLTILSVSDVWSTHRQGPYPAAMISTSTICPPRQGQSFVLIPNRLLFMGRKYPYTYPSALVDEFAPKRTTSNGHDNKSLAEGSQHILWRKNRNAPKPPEILRVEREHVNDSIRVHGCDQASVVGLGIGVDGSGPGARGHLGCPRQCLRVDILPDVRQFAISNGNGEDPMLLERPVRCFDSPRSEADDQNPVSLRYELGGLWVRSFHRFVSPLKQVLQSRVPAVRAGQRPVLARNDPLNILRRQRQQTLLFAAAECRKTILHNLDILLCAHRNLPFPYIGSCKSQRDSFHTTAICFDFSHNLIYAP